MMADITVDTKGMKCPLPVLKARKAMKALAPGGTMEVEATDPGAAKDFEHFCAVTGAVMIEAREAPGGVFVFVMRKPAA
jgi:tRNA 2-thiouridine synthesizing protein A